MPFYLVLESESSRDVRRKKWSNSLSATLDDIGIVPGRGGGGKLRGPEVLEGYCYQGAFFSPHHFAEMKEMYDKQLLAYEYGCKKLPQAARLHREVCVPRDLPALKKLLDSGKRNRKRKKNKGEVSWREGCAHRSPLSRQYVYFFPRSVSGSTLNLLFSAILSRGSCQFNELQKVVASVAKDILGLMRKDEKKERVSHAPKGVILYFEGLDCSGKSSTGGLVQAALEQAGYEVGMRQYNRPPTAEQRQDIAFSFPL